MKYFILYFVHVLMRIKNFKQTNSKQETNSNKKCNVIDTGI